MCGSLSNPLLVRPVQAVAPDISSPFSAKSSESTNPTQNNIIGAASILKKLQKVAATQSMCGSLSNPLLVRPVQAVAPDISSPFSAKSSESTNPTQNNIIGAASILKKLQKVAATQSMCGSLSNPLLVRPVQAVAPDISSPFSAKSSESTNPTQNNIIGAASILKKLQKVAATQSMCGSLSNPLLVRPVQAVAPDISSPFSAKSSESTNPTQNNIIGAASILKKLQKEITFIGIVDMLNFK
ncbi:uncharacterized protein LOC141837573 [Curcuma longa]|uniref:uncharacterized protein LOC141837573 n=1 Tax=Curcuma longa TaxID=136217 RepID=UPI003D9DFE67